VDYLLFLLVNATLFIRPAEVVADLEALPIYNILISSCALVSAHRIFSQLNGRALAEQPITLCVVGLLPAVVLSHLSHGQTYYARLGGTEFVKVVIYYLLLTGLVDSPERLRKFLSLLVGLVFVIAAMTLLDYHEIVDVPAIVSTYREDLDPATGQVYAFKQLRGSGIFSDPNDLCLVLLTAMGACAYRMGGAASSMRPLWAALLALFSYTLAMTYSRGGFLGLLVGMLVLFHSRFGWKRTLPMAAIALPVIFVLFGGRQTSLSTSGGTGQSRVQLWSLSLDAFRRAPLFGIGMGLLPDTIGQEAHNSFIHCFAELGFPGGLLFLGAFLLSFRSLRRLGAGAAPVADPEMRRLRPYMVATMASYTAGMMSLSRAYIAPTYMMPGLVVAYVRIATAGWPEPVLRFDARLARWLVLASVIFLAVAYVYVRTSVRFGGG
jgi:putative inorganic carbon (hco3(-)) transporter